jgi:hypothetical protein
LGNAKEEKRRENMNLFGFPTGLSSRKDSANRAMKSQREEDPQEFTSNGNFYVLELLVMVIVMASL